MVGKLLHTGLFCFIALSMCMQLGCTKVYDDDDEYEDEIEETTDEPSGFVDLGLPSGLRWNAEDEDGFYTFLQAYQHFRNNLPSNDQFYELLNKCRWEWQSDKKRYKVIGPNNNYVYMPTSGYTTCSGTLYNVGYGGYYWSSTENEEGTAAMGLDFDASNKGLHLDAKCSGRSVRLVRN